MLKRLFAHLMKTGAKRSGAKPQNQSCDRKRPRDPPPPARLSPYPYYSPSACPFTPLLPAAAGPPDPDKACPSCHSRDAYKCIALIISPFHVC
ncbi:unnamed protein product [Euphydryas editha]|uniref:Agouti signaling protein n=1 Tax=Euphydryas editha TaxID=104508 RepID=A0AAU9UQ04_EUPED|nr:unnamed protein product [Euphydryas editha]